MVTMVAIKLNVTTIKTKSAVSFRANIDSKKTIVVQNLVRIEPMNSNFIKIVLITKFDFKHWVDSYQLKTKCFVRLQ